MRKRIHSFIVDMCIGAETLIRPNTQGGADDGLAGPTAC